jgi:hypothetical protein
MASLRPDAPGARASRWTERQVATTRPRWTQSHITDLRARVAAGQSADLIAGDMDRSPADIRGMAGRLRLRLA